MYTAGKNASVRPSAGLFRLHLQVQTYLGQLRHQRAVLQPEVLLLTVEFPLKHLILTEQRLHFLQPDITEAFFSVLCASHDLGKIVSEYKPPSGNHGNCRKENKAHLSFFAFVQSLKTKIIKEIIKEITAAVNFYKVLIRTANADNYLLRFDKIFLQNHIFLSEDIQL